MLLYPYLNRYFHWSLFIYISTFFQFSRYFNKRLIYTFVYGSDISIFHKRYMFGIQGLAKQFYVRNYIFPLSISYSYLNLGFKSIYYINVKFYFLTPNQDLSYWTHVSITKFSLFSVYPNLYGRWYGVKK